MKEKMKIYKINKLINDEDSYFKFRKEKFHYRILSIDGGGMRGIIPAVWLCEIERKIRKPIS